MRAATLRKHLTIILVIFTAVFFLSGCGAKAPSPSETTDSFLQALKTQDEEKMKEVYSGESLDLLEATEDSGEDTEGEDDLFNSTIEDQLMPKLLDFDYEIISEQIDGDKATVDVKFTTYRIGDAFTAFLGDYITQAFVLAFSDASEDEIDALANSLLAAKLAELTEKTYEKTVTIPLTNIDGKWMVDSIEENYEVLDAITGGLYTSLTDMAEAFSDWDEEE